MTRGGANIDKRIVAGVSVWQSVYVCVVGGGGAPHVAQPFDHLLLSTLCQLLCNIRTLFGFACLLLVPSGWET